MKPYDSRVLQLIKDALRPCEAVLVKLFSEALHKQLQQLTADLERDGWNSEISYGYPKTSFCSRSDFKMQEDRYNLCKKYTGPDPVKQPCCRSMHDPDYRILRSDNAQRIQKEAELNAKLSLEGYCEKMALKVAKEAGNVPVTSATYHGNVNPWGYSHIEVALGDGTKQMWRTQMIVNTSCLGKLFNQWPTRRVDRPNKRAEVAGAAESEEASPRQAV